MLSPAICSHLTRINRKREIRTWRGEVQPMNLNLTHISKDQSGVYEIRVYGRLDKSWSDRLCGMTILSAKNSNYTEETELIGELADQAALVSILNTLYSLGFTLLFVNRKPIP
jgi:hypothetical protein